jgi:hypothetical protein
MNSQDSNNYTVTFDSKTLRVTIAGDNSFNLLLSSSSISSILGFGTTDLTSQTSYTGTYTYNLSYGDYLYLTIDELQRFARTSNLNDNTFTFILPLDVNIGEYQTYQCSDFEQELQFSPPVSIKNLTCRLTSYNNSTVDLNGSEWSFLLQIE